MSKIRSFIIGALFGCFIVGGVGYAANGFTIEVEFPSISFVVDNEKIDEIPTTIYYDGVTYAPIRFMADILDKEVLWDPVDKEIKFTSMKQVDFYEISTSDVNDEVKAWIDKSKKKRLAQIQQFGEETYILITRGSKSSGGYHVDIDRMVVNERGLWVYTRFTDPDKSSMVTEKVTHPYTLVRLAESYNGPVHFREYADRTIPVISGVSLNDPIRFENDNLILLEPEQSGQQHVIRGAVLSFEGYLSISLVNASGDELSEQTVIANQAAPDWGAFEYTLPEEASKDHVLTFHWFGIEEPFDVDQVSVPVARLLE